MHSDSQPQITSKVEVPWSCSNFSEKIPSILKDGRMDYNMKDQDNSGRFSY